jgi:aldose 1-epimerase
MAVRVSASSRPVPSGQQFRISHGDQTATIVEVGAAVREYRVDGFEVFQSYDEHDVSWGYHGTVLVPWPNRIRDGRYDFDGEAFQLGLSEPERCNAMHGLAAWQRWTPISEHTDTVSLFFRLLPSPGYPFHLDTVVTYTLGDEGLLVETTSTNVGDTPCPYGLGFHPYASTGAAAVVDECSLSVGVARRMILDERLNPIGDEAVAGTDYDFREPRSLAGRVLDDGFGEVIADDHGRSWARLSRPDGRTVALWADASFGYWQIFSGDTLPPEFARRGVAIEPMTAAPNAFVSGAGLQRLEPGEAVTSSWGATLR